jgi:hypothetical protein
MFTGFASENTPAIQVWDSFLPTGSGSAPKSVSLADDCAPVQLFRTGSSLTATLVYLPSTPIEGKRITIINACYSTTSAQALSIRSSDTRGTGSNAELYNLGQAQTIELIYVKNSISFGQNNGLYASGWIPLNFSGTTSPNYYAVALGGLGANATGNYSSVLGGSLNTASGNYSAIVGGDSNTATNTRSFVAGGLTNSAGGISSAVVGGQSNTASGSNSAVFAGDSNIISAGTNCVIVGGAAHSGNADSAIIIGGRYGNTRSIQGNTVSPASLRPITSTSGVSQSVLLVLGKQTTDATATVLASTNAAADTTNQVILPNNSAYYFKGSITAGVTGAGNSSMWSFEGGIKRGAGVGTTVLVGTPVVNLVAQDSGASTWVVALTADTTNGGLAVTVTGQASTTIRWVCKVETTEMTY